MFIVRMANETCKALVQVNTAWLQQALALLNQMDDRTYATSPKGLEPHRVASHLRHVLEFYQCFLEGLATSRIDYDARKRDAGIERSRQAAIVRIQHTIESLEQINDDVALKVRMEDADQDVYLHSTVGRELQALSSHTIHHFALISITLRLHGFEVDPSFGMSPSTLRYQASTEAA